MILTPEMSWFRRTSASVVAGCVLVIGVGTDALGQAQSEWRFDEGLGAFGGPSQLRFLDDPDFGQPLGGGTAGQTGQLAEFSDTRTLGLPFLGDNIGTVMRVPAPVDVTGAPSRSIGLVMWPDTFSDHPDGLVSEWSLIVDMLIPSESWVRPFPAAILNMDDNNGDDADLFIAAPLPGDVRRRVGSKSELIPTPLLRPDVWMRIAIVTSDSRLGKTRIFINGQFVGEIDSLGPVPSRVDPNNPTYADGTAVDPALWDRWGRFPSPWAINPPMASQITLFSDDDGEGGEVFISSLYYGESTPTSGELGCLDEPDEDRIILGNTPTCESDMDGNCMADIFDLLFFLDLWFVMDGFADFNLDLTVDIFDLLAYLDVWFAETAGGCGA